MKHQAVLITNASFKCCASNEICTLPAGSATTSIGIGILRKPKNTIALIGLIFRRLDEYFERMYKIQLTNELIAMLNLQTIDELCAIFMMIWELKRKSFIEMDAKFEELEVERISFIATYAICEIQYQVKVNMNELISLKTEVYA